MSTLRSEQLWTVAYFLSRCGHRTGSEKSPGPPAQLGAGAWSAAYDLFFDALAAGRSKGSFRSTLKNARDLFDGHLNSGRIGWRESSQQRSPQPLGEVPASILKRWERLSDDELWATVLEYIEAPKTQQASDIADAPAERATTTTYRILRDTELARRVKLIHSFECQLCGHTIHLPDGSRYAEAHHVRPLGRPHNGPDTIANIICVCPNHHAELDYGVASLDLTSLRRLDDHTIDGKYVDYHNSHIHKQ